MHGKIALIAFCLASAAAFADKPKAIKKKEPIVVDNKDREKSPGERWSEKHHDCWTKYAGQIAKRTRSIADEYDQAHKQVLEVRNRLIQDDAVLDSLTRQEKTLASGSLSPEAKGKRMQGIFISKMERERAINEHPDLKPLLVRLNEKSERMNATMKDLAGKDKDCAEILLAPKNGVPQ